MAVLLNKFLSLNRCYIFNRTTNYIRAFSSVSVPLFQKPQSTTQLETLKNVNNIEPQQQRRSEIFNKVNEMLRTQSEGRLFAVVQVCGKQFKITAGDIILVEGYWPPTSGDKISLDKVLLAGGNDFTLIGCPILKPGVCDVHATVIEKTLTHTKTHFRKKRRKQYMRINFQRSPQTTLRINSIEIQAVQDNPNSGDTVENIRLF